MFLPSYTTGVKTRYNLLFLLLFVLAGYGCTPSLPKAEWVSRPATATANRYYVGNQAPLRPLYFVKLPVTAGT